MRPRITRIWNARRGCFEWGCSGPPQGKWGCSASQQAHYDYRQAVKWCVQRNAKDQAHEAYQSR